MCDKKLLDNKKFTEIDTTHGTARVWDLDNDNAVVENGQKVKKIELKDNKDKVSSTSSNDKNTNTERRLLTDADPKTYKDDNRGASILFKNLVYLQLTYVVGLPFNIVGLGAIPSLVIGLVFVALGYKLYKFNKKYYDKQTNLVKKIKHAEYKSTSWTGLKVRSAYLCHNKLNKFVSYITGGRL